MNNTATKTEKIEFDVHKGLLNSLVFAQNGTISKGIMELVMNSIDAEASYINIVLNPNGYSVEDNGKGFTSEEDVKKHFAIFGQPHKEGDAKHGRFRIGRGQIIAFGPAKWESNHFSMDVDVEKDGFHFDFSSFEESLIDGCRVKGTFKDRIYPHQVHDTMREIKKNAAYAGVEIRFNGEIISDNIMETYWDYEDNDVRIKWNKGHGIEIYSQGIYVKTLNEHLGFSAVVLSKKALKVNMARNEVNATDPLWNKIFSILQDRSKSLVETKQKSSRFTEEMRKSYIRLFLTGALDEPFETRLIRDCKGKYYDLMDLAFSGLPLTMQPEDESRKAEAVLNGKIALPLHKETLNDFQVGNMKELLKCIYQHVNLHYQGFPRYDDFVIQYSYHAEVMDFQDAVRNVVDDSKTLDYKTLSLKQKQAKKALEYGSTAIAKHLAVTTGLNIKKRAILIGKSSVADGWTNGSTQIVIAEHMLKYLDFNLRGGAYQLALLLLHEYLHNESDEKSHEHDLDFMETFHNLASDPKSDIVGKTAESMYKRYIKLLCENNLKLPNALLGEIEKPPQNYVEKYSLSLSDKKPNKELLKLLALIDVTPRKESGDYIVTMLPSKTHDIEPRKKIVEWAREASPDMLTQKEWIQDNIGKTDRENSYTNYACLKLSESKPGSFSKDFYRKLANARYFKEYIQFLSDEPGVGIECITEERILTATRRINSKVDYEHYMGEPYNFDLSEGYYGSHNSNKVNSSVMASKDGRFKYAKSIINHAFKGLKSEEERKELASLLLCENVVNSFPCVSELFVDQGKND